jgi:hypothetical protein
MRRTNHVAAGIVLAVACLTNSVAQAQWGAWYHPYGYGWGGYGGGTVAGNELQGMSTVIRSAGEYNLYTAQAGVSYEEARGKYLDNQKKWNQSYQQMREWRSARDAQQREADKQSREIVYAASKATPPLPPIAPEALDSVTGKIGWPETLQTSDFEKPRQELEQLFELRAKTSQASGTSSKIHTATEEMSKILRTKVQKMPAGEYMAARKFIDELDRTARARS